ncbi:MAG: efflux RND transporter periplasmic adaptor subunit [Limisphaerales bacterium]
MKTGIDMRIVTVGTILVGATLIAAGCGKGGSPQQAPAMQPPKVTVAPVIQRQVTEWEEFTGRAEAVENVEVRPRVSGHVQEVRFRSGQLVKKGDVLFVIDPRWQQAEFERRNAEYEQAKVRLETAEREARRTEQLLASKAISTEEAEGRQARFSEAKAGLLAAEAARNFTKLDLEYTEIRAPIDGRVSRAIVTQGNFVSGVAGNATLLTTIVTVDPIYVYADIDENSLLRFNELVRNGKVPAADGDKVPVQQQLGNDEGFPHRGVIESFDNRLDAGTGSILLRAVFPNKDGAIVPGLFARIRVPLSAQYSALMVNESSIGTDQALKFVLTLSSSNTVEYRPVTLGPAIDGMRVVRSGLKEGEEIIVNGMARVRPGMPVVAEKADAAPAQAKEKGLAQR